MQHQYRYCRCGCSSPMDYSKISIEAEATRGRRNAPCDLPRGFRWRRKTCGFSEHMGKRGEETKTYNVQFRSVSPQILLIIDRTRSYAPRGSSVQTARPCDRIKLASIFAAADEAVSSAPAPILPPRITVTAHHSVHVHFGAEWIDGLDGCILRPSVEDRSVVPFSPHRFSKVFAHKALDGRSRIAQIAPDSLKERHRMRNCAYLRLFKRAVLLRLYPASAAFG